MERVLRFQDKRNLAGLQEKLSGTGFSWVQVLSGRSCGAKKKHPKARKAQGAKDSKAWKAYKREKCQCYDGLYGTTTLHELGNAVQDGDKAVYRRNKTTKKGDQS